MENPKILLIKKYNFTIRLHFTKNLITPYYNAKYRAHNKFVQT